jgi:hypothetical protein
MAMGKARARRALRTPEGRMMSTTTTRPRCRPTRPTRQAEAGVTRVRILGRYLTVGSKQQREVARVALPDGGAVVVDYRSRPARGDGRLVAQLAPDEPVENAQIICDLYLADESRGRCRPVSLQDFEVAEQPAAAASSPGQRPPSAKKLHDAEGYVYRLHEVATETGMFELRWTRSHSPGCEDRFEAVTLRDLVGSVQAYEPARTLTLNALAGCAKGCSTHRLRNELARLAEGPIVLNRQLRSEVQRRVQSGEVSMSEIAMRCGRVRRDACGKGSGEGTWLARRIGEKPEAGAEKATPWIHSDVLALIARDGLGINPSEVEL